MSDRYLYPSAENLIEILGNVCSAGDVKAIAADNGIFIDYGQHKDYARLMSKLFWGKAVLESIHDSAILNNHKNSLSGFWLNIDSDEGDELQNFSILQLIDSNIGQEIGKNKMKISSPSQTSDPKIFTGTVDYLEKKIGRIEFINEVKRSFKYYCRKIDENRYEFLIDVDSSRDKKVFENWIVKEIRKTETLIPSVTNLDPDSLGSHLIEFFDELATSAMVNWDFKEITKIIVKKQDDEESEEIEVDNQNLLGIQKAILEGKTLRNNSFVRECEESNYRFMAMSYRYENNDAYSIVVSSEFKERPKVFEINIVAYTRFEGEDRHSISYHLPKSIRGQILHNFYRVAKTIYDRLTIRVTLTE